jgi:hypothetical protein
VPKADPEAAIDSASVRTLLRPVREIASRLAAKIRSRLCPTMMRLKWSHRQEKQMQTHRFVKLLQGAVILGAVTLVSTAHAKEFRPLFNGKDLDGWVVEGPRADKSGKIVWTVEDELLVCQGTVFGFLRYERQQFDDFVIRVEYRFAPATKPNQYGNSGIGIRTIPYDPKASSLTRPSYASYEIQLLDDAGKQPDKHSTGSLYRYHAPKTNVAKPAPEWNCVEVECIGPRIKIRMNGEEILDADQSKIADIKDKPAKAPAPKDKPLQGFLSLQSHSGKIEFRKVEVRELGKGSAKLTSEPSQ